MGLAEIDLVWTERGDSSYRKTTLLESGGAEAALVEGAVQSRDTTLPRVKVYESLESWLCDACGLRIAADNVRPQGCFSSLFEKPPTLSPVSLAVGSERGWSDAERASLENAGFTRLSLGTRALRTETACIAAAALAAQLFAPP
jgi:RsmE family RNA methyltransferase